MARKKNHYQILGISADVSADEIKRAYRRLVKTQHPDIHEGNGGARDEATEEMVRLNEAYATLMDTAKRAAYDRVLGLNQQGRKTNGKRVFDSTDEDAQREKYLRTVFTPSRSEIVRLLGMFKSQLRDLSADPFDDELIENFTQYVDRIENALRKSSNAFASTPVPRTLEGAVLMMKQCIAQAADGLEELRSYCMNYDYNHLTMAGTLFRIASDLSKEALGLTKGR